MQRVGERLEEAGMEVHDIGEIVKRQFLALVEEHYLQRVPRPNTDLLGPNDAPSATPSQQDRFQPPPAEGTVVPGGRSGCGTLRLGGPQESSSTVVREREKRLGRRLEEMGHLMSREQRTRTRTVWKSQRLRGGRGVYP